MKIKAPEGFAFCSSCGGLYQLEKGKLPPHVAVGRGALQCEGGGPVPDGVGVRSLGED